MEKPNELGISICTVCMNRLYHLKETLPKNIEDNSGYEKLQLVLLDYNSDDEMEDWVKSNLQNYLDSGRLVYYKYPHAKVFDMAHSKNMAIKLADNEIVCLVDADNFTGPGYAQYVNSTFNKIRDSFITSIAKKMNRSPVDVFGRVALKKSDFIAIGGFDEFMSNYAHDDFDLCNRLELHGKKRIVLRNPKHLQHISHSNEERISNHKLASSLSQLYICHATYCLTNVLCLFKDYTYLHGTVIDNRYARSQFINTAFRGATTTEFSLKNGWESGSWKFTDNGITIQPTNDEANVHNSHQNEGIYLDRYFLINDHEMRNDFVFIVSALINKEKLLGNQRAKLTNVNGGVFGKGEVFRNFSNESILI